MWSVSYFLFDIQATLIHCYFFWFRGQIPADGIPCKTPGSSSDLSAFPCKFILVSSPPRARKGWIKNNWNSSLLIFWLLQGFQCFLLWSQTWSVCFIHMKQGASLLGDYGAGILMLALQLTVYNCSQQQPAQCQQTVVFLNNHLSYSSA